MVLAADQEAVGLFFDVRAELRKLDSHGMETVTFFQAHARGMNDLGRAFTDSGKGGERRHEVRAVFGIDHGPPCLRWLSNDHAVLFADVSAHLAKDGKDRFVPLL